MPETCPIECQDYGHAIVVTYRRPWRRWFRKVYILRCCDCDMRIVEPYIDSEWDHNG